MLLRILVLALVLTSCDTRTKEVDDRLFKLRNMAFDLQDKIEALQDRVANLEGFKSNVCSDEANKLKSGYVKSEYFKDKIKVTYFKSLAMYGIGDALYTEQEFQKYLKYSDAWFVRDCKYD